VRISVHTATIHA